MRKVPAAGSLAAAILFATWSGRADAVTYVMTTDDELLAKADVVVAATVRHASPASLGARPATDYVLDVERVVHGSVPAGAVVVRVPGGGRPDGSEWRLFGAPVFDPGERVVLFLVGRGEGEPHRLVELGLGAFREVEAGGERLLVRELAGSREVTLRGDARAADRRRSHRPRRREAFLAWLADRSAGVRRAADYFAAPPPVPLRDRAAYTLIRPCGNDLVVRWHEFDRGEAVRIRVDAKGQEGVAGGGFDQVKQSIALWNGDDRSDVLLRYGGTGSPPANDADGENWIYFEDPFGFLEGSFTGSGVLAAAGGDGSCAPVAFAHGKAGSIFEGDVVTQDGVGQLYFGARTAADFAEVIAHEIGHVLGLAHACGDDESPACSGAVAGALMGAFAHGDGRGARLASDDRQAIRFLYPAADPGTTGPSAPLAPNGLLVAAIPPPEGGIGLSWADNSSDETAFEVEERTAFGSFALRATLPPGSTGLVLADVPPGSFRVYRVRAVNAAGASGYSEEVAVTAYEEPGTCVPDAETLCLEGDFRARIRFVDGSGEERSATPQELTPNTGFFTFFDPANVEVVLKVLLACELNERQWVFAAGLTDVAVALTVTHAASGESRTYTNLADQAFAPIQDTDAFDRCP